MYQWLIKYAYGPNIDSNNQTNENRLGNNNVIKLPYHNAWNKLKRKKKQSQFNYKISRYICRLISEMK